jgi:hypothetical protein
MSRISLAIGRTRELMLHPVITGVLIAAVAVTLILWSRARRARGEA